MSNASVPPVSENLLLSYQDIPGGIDHNYTKPDGEVNDRLDCDRLNDMDGESEKDVMSEFGSEAASPAVSDRSSGRSSRPSSATPGNSNSTRSTRSRDNPDFVAKHKIFMAKVQAATTGVESNRPETPGKRKRESLGMLVTGKKKKLSKTDSNGQNDNYCWECHREGQVICCEMCPRVFHLKCAGMEKEPEDDWACSECHVVMQAENVENRSRAMQLISVDQLCTLLKFALSRLQGMPGMEPFMKPVDTNEFPAYRDLVVHPVDFTSLERNIKRRLYGSTEAFLADARWIPHNSVIFNGANSKITSMARSLVKILKQEMSEIETCPDCYTNAHLKPDSWFIEACRMVHPLVWARLKGFPFWPAKAVKWKDGSIDVRFFGRHDRSWVHVKECYLFSEQMPTQPKHRNKTLESCMQEVNEHITRLRERFGKFRYAPHRMQFNPNDKEQIRMLLPLYKGPQLPRVYSQPRSVSRQSTHSDDETSSITSSDSASSMRKNCRHFGVTSIVAQETGTETEVETETTSEIASNSEEIASNAEERLSVKDEEVEDPVDKKDEVKGSEEKHLITLVGDKTDAAPQKSDLDKENSSFDESRGDEDYQHSKPVFMKVDKSGFQETTAAENYAKVEEMLSIRKDYADILDSIKFKGINVTVFRKLPEELAEMHLVKDKSEAESEMSRNANECLDYSDSAKKNETGSYCTSFFQGEGLDQESGSGEERAQMHNNGEESGCDDNDTINHSDRTILDNGSMEEGSDWERSQNSDENECKSNSNNDSDGNRSDHSDSELSDNDNGGEKIGTVHALDVLSAGVSSGHTLDTVAESSHCVDEGILSSEGEKNSSSEDNDQLNNEVKSAEETENCIAQNEPHQPEVGKQGELIEGETQYEQPASEYSESAVESEGFHSKLVNEETEFEIGKGHRKDSVEANDSLSEKSESDMEVDESDSSNSNPGESKKEADKKNDSDDNTEEAIISSTNLVIKRIKNSSESELTKSGEYRKEGVKESKTDESIMHTTENDENDSLAEAVKLVQNMGAIAIKRLDRRTVEHTSGSDKVTISIAQE